MRPDRVDYSLPLFREEAQVLTLLRDVPGITPLVECGFIRLENPKDFPAEDGQSALDQLRGTRCASAWKRPRITWPPWTATWRRNGSLTWRCNAATTIIT